MACCVFVYVLLKRQSTRYGSMRVVRIQTALKLTTVALKVNIQLITFILIRTIAEYRSARRHTTQIAFLFECELFKLK